MKKEIKMSEASGKVVVGFHSFLYSPQAIVLFSDDTFACIASTKNEYDESAYIHGSMLDAEGLSESCLVESGIASEEEARDYFNRVDKAENERLIKREREEYERLKAKFES